MLAFGRPTLIAYNGYDAGLGNRVRVVLGAKSLAQLEGRRFAYVWPTGPLFGPKLSDLWVVDEGRTVSRAYSRALARIYPYVDESLTWLDDAKRSERVWQIRTGSPLVLPEQATPWQEELRSLVPVPEIARRITALFDEGLRGVPYVGVMVRAHSVSHAATKQTSPVAWFVDRMTEISTARPGTVFYLSCDVPEVADEIAARFPGCVTQRDKGGYNTVAGVQSSIVDLYLLACSGYLLGPYFSSFIHLAEHLAGDILTLETAADPAHGGVDAAAVGLCDDPLRPAVRR